MQGPVGIPEHFPSKKNGIGLTGGHNLLRLHGMGYQTNRAGGNAYLLANRCGKGSLVPRSRRDFCMGHQATAGAVNEINADLFEPAAKFYGLVQIPSSFHPICAGDPHKEREFRRPHFPNGSGDP
jgi:hypothetical protein